MMLLVFYPTYYDLPTAVFWHEDESLRSYIVADSAETRSAMYILMSKNPDSPWDEMFEWLGNQDLQSHRFDAYKVKAETSPAAFLEDLRSRSRAS